LWRASVTADPTWLGPTPMFADQSGTASTDHGVSSTTRSPTI